MGGGYTNSPASVAQVTSHRTISLLRQFNVDSVILITCKKTDRSRESTWCIKNIWSLSPVCMLFVLFTWRPSSRETLSSVRSGRLSMRVAILKASWASLKMCDAEWMFFWMDSNTVSSLRASPGKTGTDRQAKSFRFLRVLIFRETCFWKILSSFVASNYLRHVLNKYV